MIGWINLSVEAFICDSFGRDAWLKIVKQAHVDSNWVSSCPYADKVTYDIVITGAGILGVSVPQALEAYGQYFVNYVIKQGYTRLLRSLGSNIAEFLANLNNLHLHLTMGFPAMVAPAFRVEQVTSTSLLLHYHSIRPALWPIVSGVLKGASKFLFDHEVEMELVASRDAGDCDHEIFRVTYPHQESLVHWDDHGAALASSYNMTKEFFYDMFPFHIILDRECRVVQCGRVLARLFGRTLTRGSAVTDSFKLRHPYIRFDYDNMVLESNSLFLLKSLETGLELKGQMVQTSMPDGMPVLLFLGSPRVANLEEMSVHGIYLSDIPLHDMSRDFVLLAEQRQAEADLKERFEKMAVELRVANERLEQATRWLDEERQRSDALLYRMLPADIATDLREGRKVEAISYPEVTILFSDMVGFTTTSAKSTPEEVYNMLNAMYDEFDSLVDEFPDVYKLETIGDAYFLVCNLTTHCEKHVDVVIDFAVRMQALARKVKNAQGEPVQIRIGIHTGPVVGGVLGAKTPRFSIYGDTVNVASRMESHGLPGKIHISEAAYNRIVDKEKYAVRERGNIAVKGRGSMLTYLIGGTNDDWLLRHSSFDSQVDGGSFVVTASGRSAESLTPSRNYGMEAIKEGDEYRSSRDDAVTMLPSSNASLGNRSSYNREPVSGRQVAVTIGRGSTPGAATLPSSAPYNNSGQVPQLVSTARGSAESTGPAAPAPASSGGSGGAFVRAQGEAAAAVAAIAVAGSDAAATAAAPSLGAASANGGSAPGSFREGPSGLLREGSLPEAAPPVGGLLIAPNRDTSFRAVYARGGGSGRAAPSTLGSVLVPGGRSGNVAGSSLNNLVAVGSIGGASQNSDIEQVPSGEHQGPLVDGPASAPSIPRGGGGGGGGNNSPHCPFEPSPLSRPEPSGGAGPGFTQRTGIVLARSATAKASPLASVSSTGLPLTGAAAVSAPAVGGQPSVPPSSSLALAANAGTKGGPIQPVGDRNCFGTVPDAIQFGQSESGMHMPSMGGDAASNAFGRGKAKGLAKKLKNIFRK